MTEWKEGMAVAALDQSCDWERYDFGVLEHVTPTQGVAAFERSLMVRFRLKDGKIVNSKSVVEPRTSKHDMANVLHERRLSTGNKLRDALDWVALDGVTFDALDKLDAALDEICRVESKEER
jgi:hypothetical protein